LGAPLSQLTGHISLSGVVEEVLKAINDRAILIVRSHFVGATIYPLIAKGWEPVASDSLR
jgi:hypothetical protein